MNTILNEALLSTKHIQHAAIIKSKDGQVKAKSPFLSISLLDFEKISKAFVNPKEARAENGFVFSNTSYKAVRADTYSIYAKNNENCGVIVAKTANHYIIGTYDSTMFCSVAAEAVEKLADYFRKKNK